MFHVFFQCVHVCYGKPTVQNLVVFVSPQIVVAFVDKWMFQNLLIINNTHTRK